MYNFDDMVKVRAKLESLDLPDGFNERNDHLLNKLLKNPCKKMRPKGLFTPKYKIAFIFAIVILLGGSTAIASELSGGDFFINFFSKISGDDKSNVYKNIDTEQIKEMASNTVGTVVDTDELKIEVMGSIASGNTANVMVKVTVKKLDSVYYDNGVPMLSNYRFDSIEGSLFESSSQTAFRYYYSDTDKSLADNQFKILYNFIGKNIFDKKEYDIKTSKLGYVNKDLIFVSVYDTGWQYSISLDSNLDNSKEIFINEALDIDKYTFNLNNIIITPLACTISLTSDINDNNIDKYNSFESNISNVAITLKDGTKFDGKNALYSCSQNYGEYIVNLEFNIPINVDDIKFLTIMGKEYDIK